MHCMSERERCIISISISIHKPYFIHWIFMHCRLLTSFVTFSCRSCNVFLLDALSLFFLLFGSVLFRLDVIHQLMMFKHKMLFNCSEHQAICIYMCFVSLLCCVLFCFFAVHSLVARDVHLVVVFFRVRLFFLFRSIFSLHIFDLYSQFYD